MKSQKLRKMAHEGHCHQLCQMLLNTLVHWGLSSGHESNQSKVTDNCFREAVETKVWLVWVKEKQEEIRKCKCRLKVLPSREVENEAITRRWRGRNYRVLTSRKWWGAVSDIEGRKAAAPLMAWNKHKETRSRAKAEVCGLGRHNGIDPQWQHQLGRYRVDSEM